MNDKVYLEKEEAKMCLVEALDDYRNAFIKYDDDLDNLISELQDCLDSAGLGVSVSNF